MSRNRIARRSGGALRRWALAAGVSFGLAAAHPAEACGLALALAHDVSASVSAAEYRLQTKGHAAAFLDPEIQQEILAIGGATIMLMHWSGSHHQETVIGWRRLTSIAEIEAFAAELAGAGRSRTNLKTALGEMLDHAAGLWTGPARACQRRVIDISGDGVANSGQSLDPPRKRLIAAGVTINALAIANIETPGRNVHYYYRRNVIGGVGAFAIRAAGFHDYARAFREKLFRELRGPSIAEHGAPRAVFADADAR